MLPHSHFAIAGIFIVGVSFVFYPENTFKDLIFWILVGGTVSAAIDLDIILILFIKSRKDETLKPYLNVVAIYKNFKEFMDFITEKGILRIGMKTHLTISFALLLVSHLFFKEFFIPVGVGIISHLLSDFQYISRLR
ncbi:MAG: hypothetical protein ACE5K0_00995 [Candidatus Methanofastidiosia archaeon]